MTFESLSGVQNDQEPLNSAESAESSVETLPGRIELPESPQRQRQLRKKLSEYQGRLREVGNPDPDFCTNAGCKAVILQEVLRSGSADYQEVKNKIGIQGDDEEKIFDDAWRVIKDYIETGGENLKDGTGLPNEEKTSESDPEKIIGEITSFTQLLIYLEGIKHIEGSDGTLHGSAKLRRIIRGLRNQEEGYKLENLPRTYGFREKVRELLEAEQGQR